MSNLVIVAIPDENEHVWKISSDKVPHLTLLYLGDSDQIANADKIVEFVEHAANTSLQRFYLPVDRRDTLGADDADVLFFRRGGYEMKALREFRASLLQDNNIKTAYDTAQQFDGPWQPHLTLGYPAAPAKTEDTEGQQGFYDVKFVKIAVWIDDFDGPEFLLKDYWDELEALETAPGDFAMSATARAGADAVGSMLKIPSGEAQTTTAEHSIKMTATDGEIFANALVHHGTKGMKWGVRKEAPSAVAPHAESKVPHGDKRKTRISVEGGQNHPAHEDAIKVAKAKAKLAKSGPAALSNTELRDVANRVQLEQQVRQLVQPAGKKFVTNLLRNQGNQTANAVVGKQVRRKLALA